jgi:predicted nucleotidyltransferase
MEAGLEQVRSAARRCPDLALLVLFGSRVRQEHHAGSDWDFGYLGDEGLDVDGLQVELVRAMGTDHVDLVDLRRASGLLRYGVARDGLAVFKRVPGTFEDFQIEAVRFWLDVRPVVEEAHGAILREVGT